MSWIVQSLLNKRSEIRAQSDINSDEFNDLMVIERAIKELHNKGLLTSYEMAILKHVSDGNSAWRASETLGKDRDTVGKDYQRLCERVAFYLGGYFTNDGYIDYMTQKYKLNEEQVETMRAYINSRYKNKLLRSPLKTEKDNERKNKESIQAQMQA